MSAVLPEYDLYLFIAGTNSKGVTAQRNIHEICTRYLANRYALQIIDAQQQPEKAIEEGVLGLPCLIKKRPGLVRRLVGDLSDRERVLKALGIS
ncbi:MAG: circadian clock KaiB family protein [Janthinobacterium lividum]